MPIEIKELHIKINVDESPKSSSNGNSKINEQEKLIEACVEQIMEIISKKQER